MRPNDQDPDAPDEDESILRVELPPSPKFPPPPDVQYTRPTLSGNAPEPGSQKPRADLGSQRSPNATESPSVGVIKTGAGLAAGLTFGASVAGGVIVGTWADHKFPVISPWGVLVMLLVGIAAGFLNIYRLLSVTGRNGK